MFDEYNEGNQIAKTAENASMIPAGSGFLTLDEDGTACSSDYYLRLTGDGGKMLRGEIALTDIRPTPPVAGSTQIPIGSTIYLQNGGKYVCSEDGNIPMNCNRNAVGPWEKFAVVDAGNGKIALRGSNGMYVSSENGANPMTCNRASIGTWETFSWESIGAGQVTLRGNNGKYVSSEDGTASMTCNRATIGGWETFIWATTTP